MASVMTCKVHPVVLFSIVDAFERRSTKPGADDKAIGTLMGYYERGAIQVTNSYSVPFAEKDGQSYLDRQFNEHMQDMMQRAVSTEMPVGWFCTNPSLSEACLLYHDYFVKFVEKCHSTKEVLPVVLVTLDTTLQTGHMGLKAYLRTSSGIPGKPNPHCAIFNPIKVEVESFPAEQVGLDLINEGIEQRKREVFLTSGMEQLTSSTEQMVKWIDQIRNYVDDILVRDPFPADAVRALNRPLKNDDGTQTDHCVALWYKHGNPVMGRCWNQGGKIQASFGFDKKESTGDVIGSFQAGKREADSNIGRRLMELVNSVNRVSPQQYETVLNSEMRDYLMVSYLAQLAKTQLSLYGKMIST